MASLPTKIISHKQRVCALYKEALRHLQSWHPERDVFRYHAVLLRHRLDQTMQETDLRVCKKMLLDGEAELWEKQHPVRIRFGESVGGAAYDRTLYYPDWLLDTWHPYEKAAYPEYFARREIRKQEFVERWEKKYGEKAQVDNNLEVWYREGEKG
ncbi:NADH dehydrogenase [ubiquinone] 1 beta subcomplex subunit 9-like [Watersipora subatra]|uniref:NADH dehydrogenase [ubiquinone] 1 beta subcomplex subunit 9-like n=1 Tax=Watersipora subatra TaxID=2589382 RepID=UPI00355B4E1D